MIAKRVLALPLVVPFLAISGVANAGHNYQHRSGVTTPPAVASPDCARPAPSAPSDNRPWRVPER
jgi:hypothetical protein